jgi:hypothetical protein
MSLESEFYVDRVRLVDGGQTRSDSHRRFYATDNGAN